MLVFLTTIPTIFTNTYHENTGIAGLHYIALGMGLTLASQTNARFMDRIYIYFKEKNNGIGEPEFRLPSLVPGSVILPFGLLLSGWAAQKGLHWIATDIVSIFSSFRSSSLDMCYVGNGLRWWWNDSVLPRNPDLCCRRLHVACGFWYMPMSPFL